MHPPRPPTDTTDRPLDSLPAAGESHARAGLGGAPSAEELVSRAVRNAGRSRQRTLRWVHVCDVFAVGSGVAQALCDAHGCDPDEHVGQEDPEVCVELHSRGRVAGLRAVVDREIAEVRQQAKLPFQQGVLGWLTTSREALDGAERLLGMAEQKLAIVEAAKREGR